jgi:hypothetical protein
MPRERDRSAAQGPTVTESSAWSPLAAMWAVRDDKNLTSTGKLVGYTIISRAALKTENGHVEGCWIWSQARIARDARLGGKSGSKSSVKRALSELRSLGIISWRERTVDGSNERAENEYRVEVGWTAEVGFLTPHVGRVTPQGGTINAPHVGRITPQGGTINAQISSPSQSSISGERSAVALPGSAPPTGTPVPLDAAPPTGTPVPLRPELHDASTGTPVPHKRHEASSNLPSLRSGAPHAPVRADRKTEAESQAPEALTLDLEERPSPSEETPKARASRKKRQRTYCPNADASPDEINLWLVREGLPLDNPLVLAMLDHHRKEGKSSACWRSSWSTWVRNEPKFQRIARVQPAPPGGGNYKIGDGTGPHPIGGPEETRKREAAEQRRNDDNFARLKREAVGPPPGLSAAVDADQKQAARARAALGRATSAPTSFTGAKVSRPPATQDEIAATLAKQNADAVEWLRRETEAGRAAGGQGGT